MLPGGDVGSDETVLYVYCDGESTTLHGWKNCLGLNTHTRTSDTGEILRGE